MPQDFIDRLTPSIDTMRSARESLDATGRTVLKGADLYDKVSDFVDACNVAIGPEDGDAVLSSGITADQQRNMAYGASALKDTWVERPSGIEQPWENWELCYNVKTLEAQGDLGAIPGMMVAHAQSNNAPLSVVVTEKKAGGVTETTVHRIIGEKVVAGERVQVLVTTVTVTDKAGAVIRKEISSTEVTTVDVIKQIGE